MLLIRYNESLDNGWKDCGLLVRQNLEFEFKNACTVRNCDY